MTGIVRPDGQTRVTMFYTQTQAASFLQAIRLDSLIGLINSYVTSQGDTKYILARAKKTLWGIKSISRCTSQSTKVSRWCIISAGFYPISILFLMATDSSSSSSLRLHLGASDHITIMLMPAYRPLVKVTKPVHKQIQVWPDGSSEALQDCFDTTDWDMFKQAATYNNATDLQEY